MLKLGLLHSSCYSIACNMRLLKSMHYSHKLKVVNPNSYSNYNPPSSSFCDSYLYLIIFYPTQGTCCGNTLNAKIPLAMLKLIRLGVTISSYWVVAYDLMAFVFGYGFENMFSILVGDEWIVSCSSMVFYCCSQCEDEK